MMGSAEYIEEEKRLASKLITALQSADLPDLKGVVCAFFQEVGGQKAYARLLVREFRRSKVGSMIRARILEMILHATKTMSAREGAKDVQLLSDADLDRELMKMLSKIPRNGEIASAEDARHTPPLVGEVARAIKTGQKSGPSPDQAPATERDHVEGDSGGPEEVVAREDQAEHRDPETVRAYADPEGL
jgi:hypothetical protein